MTARPRASGAPAALLLGAVLLAACSSSSPGASSSTTTTAPATSSSSDASTTSGPATTKLTAWGAVLSDWNANHTPDPSHPGNYWPRLPNGIDSYTSQGVVAGRVVHYVLNFDPAQSESDTRLSVGNELPTDATVVSSRTLSGCEQIVETSPTLRDLVHADVLAELQSARGFNPSAVNRLTLSALAPGSPPPASC